MFKKTEKDKFVFYSLDDAVTYGWPIRPATDFKMPWFEESKKEFANARKNTSLVKHTGTHMCSGVMGFLDQAWILTTWQDVIITTNNDKETFQFQYPCITPMNPNGVCKTFEDKRLMDHLSLPAETVKNVIKFELPWRFHAPKGWGLKILPLHYHNETRFTSATGILDPEISNHINSIVYWHVLDGEVMLKAGTPLCYLYPIKLNTNFNFEVRTATEKEYNFDRSIQLAMSSSWIQCRSVFSILYKNLFHK